MNVKAQLFTMKNDDALFEKLCQSAQIVHVEHVSRPASEKTCPKAIWQSVAERIHLDRFILMGRQH